MLRVWGAYTWRGLFSEFLRYAVSYITTFFHLLEALSLNVFNHVNEPRLSVVIVTYTSLFRPRAGQIPFKLSCLITACVSFKNTRF